MFTDMVGFSALAQRKEALALDLLAEHQDKLRPIFVEHGGREIKAIGDGFLVEFASALQAVRCAIAIQTALVEHNAAAAPELAGKPPRQCGIQPRPSAEGHDGNAFPQEQFAQSARRVQAKDRGLDRVAQTPDDFGDQHLGTSDLHHVNEQTHTDRRRRSGHCRGGCASAAIAHGTRS